VAVFVCQALPIEKAVFLSFLIFVKSLVYRCFIDIKHGFVFSRNVLPIGRYGQKKAAHKMHCFEKITSLS
jgi:hypothetical protein